jgi:hypothetical protein
LVLGQEAIGGLYFMQNGRWGLGNIRRHAAKNRNSPQRCAENRSGGDGTAPDRYPGENCKQTVMRLCLVNSRTTPI